MKNKTYCATLFTLTLAARLLTSRGAGPGRRRFYDPIRWQIAPGLEAQTSMAGYGVKDGIIFCARGGGGTCTEREFSDFVLRFEFKLEEGSNNGIGIRAPLEGRLSTLGMEIQILEEGAAWQANGASFNDTQFHGSVYDVIPAKKGALKKPGEWNTEEITAQGRQIKVVVNGQTILEADLNSVANRQTLEKHPGILRDRGHIGFLGHDDYLEFRNIRIKELPKSEQDNTPPAGFTALFNGRDLTGWKGLLASPYDNPIKRAPSRRRGTCAGRNGRRGYARALEGRTARLSSMAKAAALHRSRLRRLSRC